jgi:hypothetical protein
MTEPYADRTCSHGYMTMGEDEIYRRMERARCAGYQIRIQAIRDRRPGNRELPAPFRKAD